MSDRGHLKTCGTSYRGRDPQCPSRLADEAEERRDARASLTDSEVALAKMLSAWEEWPGDLDHHRETLLVIGAALEKHALIAEGQPSEDGRALLDRARRAGVL